MPRSLAVLALTLSLTDAQGNLPCFTNFGNSSFNLAPYRSGTSTGSVPAQTSLDTPSSFVIPSPALDLPTHTSPPPHPIPYPCRYSVIDSLNNANSRNYTYFFDL